MNDPNVNRLAQSKYPDAADIPELNAPTPGSADDMKLNAQNHPIVQALQTLQTAVLGMEQKGVANAADIKQKFLDLLQSLMQSGQAGGAVGAPPNTAAPSPGANEQQAASQPGGAMPGGAPGAIQPNAAGKTARPMI